jgi:hypothetical protein
MKKKNLLFAYFVFMTAVLMLTSCTLEKRHYRNGYYVQRTSGTFRQNEHAMQSARVPSNVALIDTAETATSKDSSVIDFNSEAVEKRDAGSSTIKPQVHASSRELKKTDQKIVSVEQTESNYTRPDSERNFAIDDNNYGKPDHGKVWFWIFVSLMLVAILGIPCYILGAEILAVAMIGTGSLGGIIAFVGSLISNRKKAGIQSEEAAKLRRKRRWASMWIFLGIILGIIVSIVSLILAWGG